jgi:hypothetical protein
MKPSELSLAWARRSRDSRSASESAQTTQNCVANASTAVVASFCCVSTSKPTVSPWMAVLLSTAPIRVRSPSRGLLDWRVLTEYIAGRVFKIKNLSWVDATLLEPASCAAHGLDKIAPKMGSSVLMLGAGPTGLVRYTSAKGYPQDSPLFLGAHADAPPKWRMPRCCCCT